MRALAALVAIVSLIGCGGPDWKKGRVMGDIICADGSTPNSDGKCLVTPTCPVTLTDGQCLVTPVCAFPLVDGKCLLPETCPVALTGGKCLLTPVCPISLTEGRCLLTPQCPVPLTDGQCEWKPACPVALTDGFCLLTPSCPGTLIDGQCLLPVQCPEGSTLGDGNICFYPAICPPGTTRHGSKCYEPAECPANHVYDFDSFTCRKVCQNHANQNPNTCANGWLSVDESCDCPPAQCQNPNECTIRCDASNTGSVYVP